MPYGARSPGRAGTATPCFAPPPAEFINLISSEANEICSKEDKRTIAPEHVLQALESLGFSSYLAEVQAAYDQHKSETLVTHARPHAPPHTPLLSAVFHGVTTHAGAVEQRQGTSDCLPCMLPSTLPSSILLLPPLPVQESPRALGRSSSSKASGAVVMSEEEAIAEQQKMFAEARAAMLNLQRPAS
ncbi:unnamed protein product [Closterium sp. Naga37s-1]|nr:unnamed protein product [Closterium sp. Naga37s-1]